MKGVGETGALLALFIAIGLSAGCSKRSISTGAPAYWAIAHGERVVGWTETQEEMARELYPRAVRTEPEPVEIPQGEAGLSGAEKAAH